MVLREPYGGAVFKPKSGMCKANVLLNGLLVVLPLLPISHVLQEIVEDPVDGKHLT